MEQAVQRAKARLSSVANEARPKLRELLEKTCVPGVIATANAVSARLGYLQARARHVE